MAQEKLYRYRWYGLLTAGVTTLCAPQHPGRWEETSPGVVAFSSALRRGLFGAGPVPAGEAAVARGGAATRGAQAAAGVAPAATALAAQAQRLTVTGAPSPRCHARSRRSDNARRAVPDVDKDAPFQRTQDDQADEDEAMALVARLQRDAAAASAAGAGPGGGVWRGARHAFCVGTD